MKKIYHYFLFIIFILLTAGSFCSAKLEVEIPGLPGNPTLIDYRDVLFNFFIGLGGAIAVLALVIGAIQWMTSAGNPDAVGNARKRIIGSIFGLILLFSSYLIMKTINPALLTNKNPAELPDNFDVILTDGTEETPCPPSIDDTSKLGVFKTLKYKCPEGLEGIMPTLWVRKFPTANLIPWVQQWIVELKCGGTTAISDAKSFMWEKEKPGLYLTTVGGKDRSKQILKSQPEMDQDYKKNTKSFIIVNDEKTKTYYGVIFHEGIDQTGKCSKIYFGKVPLITGKLDFSPSSFTFFQLNLEPKTSGDGVDFYSHPYGWQVAARAGKYSFPPDIYKNYAFSLGLGASWPAEAEFDYTGIDRTDEEKELCYKIADIPKISCGGSINIKGDYLVYICSTDGNYCQGFDKYSSQQNNSATTLRTSWLLRDNDISKGKIWVISIKPI
ncbi:pilin [Patescibacteria group bacterium]|nr:pilin [Patescibacteria group bacterium]